MYNISIEEQQELCNLVALAQKYMWRSDDCRRFLQDSSIHLVRGDFYSPIPTLAEIDASWENSEEPPYLNEQYDPEFMREYLEVELAPYSREFTAPTEEQASTQQFYWKNPQFSYSDAMAYYCMIRSRKPKKIIEIGAGFSTLVALEAMNRNGFGEIVCVEPYPSEQLKSVADRIAIIKAPVQSSGVQDMLRDLGENDILFIDSTHTVKVGGDCLYIYLVLLPLLKRGVVVHVHDIYLPYMFNKDNILLQQYWMEQYLLWAYMLKNDNVKILYGSYYHYMQNREALDRFMNESFESRGASFFFSIT